MTTAFSPVTVRCAAAANWLNVTSHLDPRFGGIAAVLPSLCQAAASAGMGQVGLAGFCLPDEVLPSWGGGLALHRYPLGWQRWLTDAPLRQEFSSRVQQADGVHIHGLWQPHCQLAGYFARRHGRPYLVSAHGMLEAWALRQNRWQKAIYSRLLEHSNLESAQCLHALTQAEAGDYRRFGLRNPVVVIPNGVEIPSTAQPQRFRDAWPATEGRRVVLFLGRLHPKKGVDLLCRAWQTVAARWPEAHLVLAGPDTGNTRAGLEQLVSESHLGRSVTFTGMLRGEDKWNALAAADLFVLPSHSEGFSVSVLEAMGMGCPVLVTHACHVPEVDHAEAGWTIEPRTSEIRHALEYFFRLPAAAARARGAHGRALVRERYGWSTVGRQMAEVYAWLSGGTEPWSVEIQRA